MAIFLLLCAQQASERAARGADACLRLAHKESDVDFNRPLGEAKWREQFASRKEAMRRAESIQISTRRLPD